MAGLLSAAPPPAAAPAEPAVAGPEVVDDSDLEQPNVSPEEQEAYEAFVDAGLLLLYEGGEARPAVLKMLDDDPSDLMAVLENVDELGEFTPVIALAATAAITTFNVAQKMQGVPEEVIFHGGKALLEDLAELAEAAGIRSYTVEEIGEAFRMGADLYREIAVDAGLVDVEAAKAAFGEFVEMDKAGRLGELSPELASLNEQPPEQPPAAMPPEGAVQ